MLCTSTGPESLDAGFKAANPLLLLLLLLAAFPHGYGPCAAGPTRGNVSTSAPLLAFLAATTLSAATSSSSVSCMTLPLQVHRNHVGWTFRNGVSEMIAIMCKAGARLCRLRKCRGTWERR